MFFETAVRIISCLFVLFVLFLSVVILYCTLVNKSVKGVKRDADYKTVRRKCEKVRR